MIKLLTASFAILLLLCTASNIQPTIKAHEPAVMAAPSKGNSSITGSPKNLHGDLLNKIEQKEYEFKKTAANNYAAPNRKNNLRFFYTEQGFTTEPRIKQKQSWNAAFVLRQKEINKGKWNIDGNKAEYITDNITVQYINNKDGMRQNFIVASPLSKDDNSLKIHFGITTGLQVKLHDTELQFFDQHQNNVLNYSQLKVWDANNKPLIAAFEKEGKDYCINVNTNGASYPITIDPISTSPSEKLESNQANAQMGISVSSAGDVNGDGYSDIIVGAHLFDNGQTDEGRAYIYHGSDTGISSTAAAILESNQASAQFGIAVATAGDVNGDGFSDVLVGANLYDGGQTDEGAVFIYHGAAGGINTTAAIRLESNVTASNFGIAVATAGDVNSDGFSDIIAGSNLFSFGQTNEGVAIVYRGSATGIVNTTAAILQINQAGANMGISVASAGDINGDGYSDVIVGVPLYNGGLAGEGAATIFTGSASGINLTAAATLESNQLNANMGQSVSSAGDVNGDGYGDVVIGANLYDKGQTDEGAAFIYHGSAAGIVAVAVDTLESNQASANFGRSVAAAGDINGDGYSDVIIGCHLYDNGQTDEGVAFVFQGSSAGIINTAIATIESNLASGNMGIAVASAGDNNGDGYSDVIVGANLFDNGETDEGAVFIYNGSAASIRLIQATALANSPLNNLKTNQSLDLFGTSVAAAGDVNGDGFSDIIVGAMQFDHGEANEGAAFIFHGTASGISTVAADTVEGNSATAFMGAAVSSAGDVNGDGFSDIIVGAYNYNKGQTGEGIAVVYYGSVNGINTLSGDTIQSNQISARLGNTVACAGDINGDGYSDVIVGANLFDYGQTDEGIAVIYYGAASGINPLLGDTLQCNQVSANFGYSVSGAGDINGDGYSDIIIGAKYYDRGQVDEGAAFIYYGSSNGIINTPVATLDDDIQSDIFGSAVACAGDVNGDGYSDVLVGAPGFDNNMPNAGATYVYHGSAAGLDTIPAVRLEAQVSQFNDAFFGAAVAGAGDVNGDGYSDIIAGAPQYTFGNSYEGRSYVFLGSPNGVVPVINAVLITGMSSSFNGSSVASAGDINGDGFSDVISGSPRAATPFIASAYVYYGNGGDMGLQNKVRLYNSDQTTPLQQSNNSDLLFSAGLSAKSPMGRQKGKMVIETIRNGTPFSGSPITNSNSFTATDATFSNLGLNGVELKRQAIKMIPTKATNIRARVKYDAVTAITGQVYGPWRYEQNYLTGATNKILSVITFNWTGNVSTVWENPANWSSNVVPTATSAVIIPSGRPRYPIINVTTSIKSISLAPGSSANTASGVTLNILGH